MVTLNHILLMLGLFACSQKVVKQPNSYFEVLQATSRSWVSGVPGGGSGIDYRFQIKIKTNRSIQFDSIWVAGKKQKVKLEKAGEYGEAKLTRNDVVTLFASDYRGSPGKGINPREEQKKHDSKADSAKAPIPFAGAALLKYTVDGSAKYFEVPAITVLPRIYGQ